MQGTRLSALNQPSDLHFPPLTTYLASETLGWNPGSAIYCVTFNKFPNPQAWFPHL